MTEPTGTTLVLPDHAPGPASPLPSDDQGEPVPLPIGVRPEFPRLLAEALAMADLPRTIPNWLAGPTEESRVEQYQQTLRAIVLSVAINPQEQSLAVDLLCRYLQDYIKYRNTAVTPLESIISFLRGGMRVGVFTRFSSRRDDTAAASAQARQHALQALFAVMEALPGQSFVRASHHHGYGSSNAGFGANGQHSVWAWEFASILPIIHLLVIVSASGFVTDLESAYRATLQMAMNSVWAWVPENRQVYFVPTWLVQRYCLNPGEFWNVPRPLRHPFVRMEDASIARIHNTSSHGLNLHKRHESFYQPIWTRAQLVDMDPGVGEMLGGTYSVAESVQLLIGAETAPLPPGDNGPRLFRNV